MAVEKIYYVYIGINYPASPNESHRLKFSNDADEICQILNLPEDNYALHTNNINKKDLSNILSNLNADKFSGFDILIYIAGHGIVGELQKPSLKTSDGELRFDDIFELLNENVYANNIAVILDCCHSGISKLPKKNMYWIAATAENATTNNQFHENLANYLNYNNNLNIDGLIGHLRLHGHIEQPSTTIHSTKQFNLAKHRNNISIKINEYFLLKRGKLRTAYPININFNQIFDEGLYVASIIQDGKKEHTLDYYINSYSPTKSYLILGSPGSGKSFLSFLLQKKLVTLGYNVIALSFQEVNELLSTDDSQLNVENIQIKKIINEATISKTEKIVFLIDGVDEFNAWDKYTYFFDKLTENAGVVAFSRETEYYNNVSKYLPDRIFDKILKIKQWQYEQEFNNFLAILLDKKYITKYECDKILSNAKDFQEHLFTPLHSRMYIYIYENDDQSELLIRNKGWLYFLYIQKLAKEDQVIIDLWKTLAFQAFTSLRNNYSIISESEYSNTIEKYQSEQRRVISYILQLKKEIHGNYYNFIHYSFYEFFVALFISSKVREAFQASPQLLDTSELFKFDLSFPIRHYLADLFSLDPIVQQEGFVSFLQSLYDYITDYDKCSLIKKNLIIYFISKLNKETALPCLKNILHREVDIFLKNSLYWACIRKNDKQIFDLYISLLNSNQEYCFYNRGYHLYYYGDMITEKFPFIDKDENASWIKTKEFMMNHRINSCKDNSLFIQLLDIWTYIDLAVFHKTFLENEDVVLLKNRYNNLLYLLTEKTKKLFENLFVQLKGLQND